MKNLYGILSLNFVVLLHYSAFLGLLQTHGVAGIDEDGNSTCPMTEFTCGNGKCIILSWKCDTHSDCPDGSDELNCPDRTCSEDEFRCRTGDCIPLRWSCDEDDSDCPDGSDEDRNICTSRTCGPNHFACDSGLCIPAAWKCDETSDCKETNGEDERNCTTPEVCEGDMFQCANKRCISKKWVCDKDNDCMDNSDEVDCDHSPECEEHQFRCDDGTCINEDWICDGEFDCNNHTDEQNCPPIVDPCQDYQFECKTSQTCIHQSWFCDGDPDCPDESDEVCNVTCSEGHFLCTKDKYCLSNSLRCDGLADCQDGSDEVNCTTPSVCADGQFSCGEDNPTKCISLKMVCDGTDDCGNEADEDMSLGCGYNPCDSFNGGCEHTCINKFRHQRECRCKPGFKLAKGSDTKCVDVNECEDNAIRGTCSQRCINKEGSYKCECFENYSLERKRYCKADNGGHPLLLLANKKDLRSIHLETFQYKLLLDNDKIHEAIAMDFHFSGKKFYWTDVKLEQILRADFDNVSSVEVIVHKNIHTPDGLAVDWINNNIYWTDTGLKRIEVASLDGSMRKVLIDSNLGEPRAIVLDPNNGYVYWTDWGTEPKIERCTMNGDHRETIVSSGISWPNGLTIDYEGNRLYWMDAKLHKIESSDMTGSNRVTVLTSHIHLRRPFAITVFEDYLYWTDGPTESVRKYSKFSQGKVETIALNLHAPMDIHVFHPYRQHTSDKGLQFCGNYKRGCSHFCFPNPMAADSYSCGCPDGFTLSGDGHNCAQGGTATGHESTTIQPTLPDSDNRSRNNGSDTSVTPESTTHFVEITTEDLGGYTVVNPANHTTVNTPQIKKEEQIGKIAGIVVAVLSVLIIIAAVVCVVLYKRYSRNHGKSMNFDNPVYRKTTTDELIIEKNGVNPNLPDSRQPLTQNTNEIV